MLLSSDLLQGLKVIKVDKYVVVASAVILLYDFLLTLPAEVKYIWGKKWNLTAVIFWICRYTAFIDIVFLSIYQEFTLTLPENACKILYNAKAWILIATEVLAEVILILRTYSIWNGDRRIAALLFILLGAGAAGTSVLAQRFLLSLTYAPTPSVSAFPGCFVAKAAEGLWGAYTILVVFETIILGLTVSRVVYDGRFQHSSILRKMYTDGILFYVYDFMFSVVVIVALAMSSLIALTPGLTSISRALHTIVSYRLLLNIQKAVVTSSTSGLIRSDSPATGREAPRSRSRIQVDETGVRVHETDIIELELIK